MRSERYSTTKDPMALLSN